MSDDGGGTSIVGAFPEWVTAGVEVIVGLGFCLGILLMNLPQHYLCWKHRSAEGLSLAYILICTISNATLALATIMGDYHEIMVQATATTTDPTGTFGSTPGTYVTNSTFLISDPESSASQRSLSFWQVLLPSEEPIPGLLRLLRTTNAAMPTIQNFMSLWIGVPSLLIYYFWFSQPKPQRHQSQSSATSYSKENTDSMVTMSSPSRNSSPQKPKKHIRNTSDEPLLLPKYRPSYSDLSTDTADLSFTSGSDEIILGEDLTSRSRRVVRYYYSDGTEARWAVVMTLLTWSIVGIVFWVSARALWNGNNGDSLFQTNVLLEFWGSIATVTNMMLFVPQIVTTHRNQHEGVLSLLSLVVSVVGDIAQAAFWIVSTGESLWIYSSCAADAGMQLILIAMILDFRQQRRAIASSSDYQYVYDAELADEVTVGSDEDEQMPSGRQETTIVGSMQDELLDIYSTASTVAADWLWEEPSENKCEANENEALTLLV